MNTNTHKLTTILTILITGLLLALRCEATLIEATDVNPDPNIFECYITAVHQDVIINGTNVHCMVFKDDPPGPFVSAGATIPGPQIKLKVGEMVICHFKNSLTNEDASIHWHGIELDNDSDGTAVTQDALHPGQSYVYQFLTARPGLFWYHSHMLPGDTLFAGMYGIIIIENNIEDQLRADGKLPAEADTFTLALSDIDFDSTGKVSKDFGGTTKTINQLIELCHLQNIGNPGGDRAACGAATPGNTILVNGENPNSGAQTPHFTVPSGKRIRLRLLNESIARHYRLRLLNSGETNIFRIGGQGGLLDNVRLEGGTLGTWDTKFNKGEIVIGSGERADCLIFPTGSEGSVVQLVANPLPDPFKLSGGVAANAPIAFFQISGTASDTAPAEGDPILAGTAEDIENLKGAIPLDTLISPAPFGGSTSTTIRFANGIPAGFTATAPNIDDFAAPLDSNAGNGDFVNVPRPPSARYARVGDVLELANKNETTGSAVHPFHLHGFSLQPVRVQTNDGTNLFDFNYDEFLDTITVYPGQTLVFRVRLDDRPKICDLAPSFPPGPVLGPCIDAPCGGALGRWLFHCHIVHHGSLGMISELTVLTNLVDSPPVITCPNSITNNNDPGACSAVVTFQVTATDDCAVTNLICVPPSGSTFAKGASTVTCTATDNSGQTNSCSFDVIVIDNEPPKVACRPATNPSGKKIPTAGKNPKSGQNPDGYYQLLAKDNCDPNPQIFVGDSGSAFIAGPFANGDIVKITQSPDEPPFQKPGPKDIVAHIRLKGDALVYAADADGNVASAVSCLVPPPPK